MRRGLCIDLILSRFANTTVKISPWRDCSYMLHNALSIFRVEDMSLSIFRYRSDDSGLVWGFLMGAGRQALPIGADEALARMRAPMSGEFVWLHFHRSNAASERWLHAHTSLQDGFYDEEFAVAPSDHASLQERIKLSQAGHECRRRSVGAACARSLDRAWVCRADHSGSGMAASAHATATLRPGQACASRLRSSTRM
jgi:hypothetical protein